MGIIGIETRKGFVLELFLYAWLILPEFLGFTGSYLIYGVVESEPYGDSRGVVDDIGFYGKLQSTVRLHILVNFHVGGVPDVIATADLLTEGFDAVPVIVLLKFIRVSPYVEEPRV